MRSSGALIVKDIDGNLSIGQDGSGGIQHERVGGRISLPEPNR